MIGDIIKFVRHRKRAKLDPVSCSLENLSSRVKPFTFLQIGSSDGGLNDPLKKHIGCREAIGVFVEPLSTSLQKLQKKYAGYDGLFYENCAVDDHSGQRVIYQIGGDASSLPAWAYQVASFDRQVLLSHEAQIPDVVSRIVERIVPCRTISEIIDQYQMIEIDCLQIDTEGYDHIVVASFPMHVTKPKLIIFEHKHLSGDALNETIGYLRREQYSIRVAAEDVVAELA